MIDHDGLRSAVKDLPNCYVLKLHKNGGALALNDMAKRKSRDIKYENYFFDEKFMCSRDQIPISKLQLYKISKTTSMGRSEIFLVKVEPAVNELQKSILGITFMTIKAASTISEV